MFQQRHDTFYYCIHGLPCLFICFWLLISHLCISRIFITPINYDHRPNSVDLVTNTGKLQRRVYNFRAIHV